MDAVLVFAFVADWLIRIGALFVVPSNRKPSSATAWLMLILLLPFIGLLIFILIGSPKLNRRRRAMQRSMDGVIKTTLNRAQKSELSKYFVDNEHERNGAFMKLNNNLGGFPAFDGNDAKLLEDYDKAFDDIAKSISKAERYVHIEYFIVVMDDATEAIFVEMEKAVQRGVKVRLLYDTLGTRGYPGQKEMNRRLSEIGVQWHKMLPLKRPGKNFNRPDLRNHRKIVVVDGQIGYTGSQNLVRRNYHRKDNLYYDELVVKVKGPIVLQLQAAFITDWYSETGDLLDREHNKELEFDVKDAGNKIMQTLPSGPGFENDNNLKLFTELIHAAKERIIIINPYFVPDDALITAITTASQRDVEVVMINSEVMDQKMVGHAQRSYFEELLKSGVKIYQYDKPILLHSKFMVIDDDLGVIGSSNLDMRSFQLNLEISLVVYDKGLARGLMDVADKYRKRSHRVQLDEWNLRSWKTRLAENLARLTSAIQ